MKGEPTEPARDAGESNAMNDKGRRPYPSEGLRTGTGAQYAGLVAEVLRERQQKGPARGVTDDKEAPRAVIMNNGRGGVKPSPLAKYKPNDRRRRAEGMANCYVWLNIEPEGLPTMSSIMFIGKEPECIEWVRRATYKQSISPKIHHELRDGFYFRNRPEKIHCRLTAGEGETRIERNFNITMNYK